MKYVNFYLSQIYSLDQYLFCGIITDKQTIKYILMNLYNEEIHELASDNINKVLIVYLQYFNGHND